MGTTPPTRWCGAIGAEAAHWLRHAVERLRGAVHPGIGLLEADEWFPRALLGRGHDDAWFGRLRRLGLIELRRGLVRARACVSRHAGLLIAHDFDVEDRRRGVMGVGTNASVLARMTPSCGGGRVLDVGCGQGFLALRAAALAGAVVGVDPCRHSLWYARMNAALNRVTNVEFRRGHLFEPVGHGRFDLIVSNPPFVFSPTHAVTAGGAAARGDELTKALLRQAPSRLREGGMAAFICNWEHKDPARWDAAPRAWLRDSGCDAWIVRQRVASRTNMLAGWERSLEGDTSLSQREALRRWKEHVVAADVGILVLGLVFLRKRRGETWVRAEEQQLADGQGAGGRQVLRVFENETLVRTEQDAALLSRVFRRRSEVRCAAAEHDRGFRMPLAAGSDARALLAAFDVPRRALEAGATAFGQAAERTLPALRTLLSSAYVRPA